VTTGCLQAGCTLLGGETAELPDLYAAGHYDLAGFAVGRQAWHPCAPVKVGDAVIGLASSGFHSNGYALIRRIMHTANLDYQTAYDEIGGQVLGNVLLAPTIVYVGAVRRLWQEVPIKAMAHITGGGLIDNVPRTLPKDVGVALFKDSWPVPPVMSWFQQLGGVADDEMFHTFNMGIGFTLTVAEDQAEAALALLQSQQLSAYVIGRIDEQPGVHWA
ncbi:MAG: phosphoribosylformylglycinamidine cyclo-ligase, partial [Firmicutes bacterium]|nr:phosphoribosylformylglycinamidine cyclo-ligase [Bacillota bacterium]